MGTFSPPHVNAHTLHSHANHVIQSLFVWSSQPLPLSCHQMREVSLLPSFPTRLSFLSTPTPPPWASGILSNANWLRNDDGPPHHPKGKMEGVKKRRGAGDECCSPPGKLLMFSADDSFYYSLSLSFYSHSFELRHSFLSLFFFFWVLPWM